MIGKTGNVDRKLIVEFNSISSPTRLNGWMEGDTERVYEFWPVNYVQL